MTRDSSVRKDGQDKVLRYKWSNPGQPGRFLMLHKDQIVIPEDSYQRAALGGDRDTKVLKIASEFSWVAFQIISVAERDGVFFALDGGHRLRAARRRSDVDIVPCMVFETNSIEEEAKAFDTVNTNRKSMGAVDRHRAHIIQKEDTAIVAEMYAARAGRRIASKSTADTIKCVNDLKKCIKEDRDALDAIWPVVIEICRGEVMSQVIILGLFYLQRFASEPVNSPRITNKILSLGYGSMTKAAQAGAAFHGHRTQRSFADGMLKAINKGFKYKVDIDK